MRGESLTGGERSRLRGESREKGGEGGGGLVGARHHGRARGGIAWHGHQAKAKQGDGTRTIVMPKARGHRRARSS